jgi:type IV secretory pathway VirB9-like protein
MMVSNDELATKITNDNLERLKKAGDRMAYLKEKMYYPQEVDDIFLNEDTNIFDIEAAKRQKTRLLMQERTGTPVVLYDDGQGVKHEFTDKLPISNFPLKNSDAKDAPVVIYE